MTQPVPPPDLHPSVKHLLSTYCIGRKLGNGSFGTVRDEMRDEGRVTYSCNADQYLRCTRVQICCGACRRRCQCQGLTSHHTGDPVLECLGDCLQVREAQHIRTKERVAIKVISRARMSEEAGAEDKGAPVACSQTFTTGCEAADYAEDAEIVTPGAPCNVPGPSSSAITGVRPHF